MNHWIPAYIGIGSNVADPPAQVRRALAALAGLPATRLVASSALYRTRPFGPVPQDDFTNAVAAVLTQLAPPRLLAAMQALEAGQGRVRTQRWGPRTLDLDLLVYGNERIELPGLVVPHPGIAERGFVLRPLADVAPELAVPGVGRVAALLARLPQDGVIGRIEA